MKKITLFVLMAVCVVVLLTTEPCEGKKRSDVAAEEGGEGTNGDKPMGRGRHNRERRPGHDDEQPGQAGEHENGKGPGRRHHHHGKDKNNKTRDETSPSSGSE